MRTAYFILSSFCLTCFGIPILTHTHQVVVPLDKKKVDPESLTLVEVGPRFCLNPIRIFDGAFGGRTLYESPTYVSPNAVGLAPMLDSLGGGGWLVERLLAVLAGRGLGDLVGCQER